MNDHNLDDLIIDTIVPKATKSKNLLTFVALLIIVLIVAIILTKTLLKSPTDNELVFEENISEMLAPELKLQEHTEIAKPKEEPSLSTMIEEKVKVKKTEVKALEVTHEETVSIEEEVKYVTKEQKPKPVQIKKPIVTKAKQAIELPVTQEPIHKETPKVVTTSKPTTKVTKPTKTTKKPVVKHQAPTTANSGNYYVQVGSFKENPSPRFLSVIKGSGFKYHVTNPDRTGYKKLLIGPYKTRAEVDKARDMIRDRIHKSAFVVQK